MSNPLPTVLRYTSLSLPNFEEESISWDGAELVLFGSKCRRCSPSPESWEVFWKVLDTVRAWEWEAEYTSPTLDGHSWGLKIVHEDRSLSTGGSNAYPRGFQIVQRLLYEMVKASDVAGGGALLQAAQSVALGLSDDTSVQELAAELRDAELSLDPMRTQATIETLCSRGEEVLEILPELIRIGSASGLCNTEPIQNLIETSEPNKISNELLRKLITLLGSEFTGTLGGPLLRLVRLAGSSSDYEAALRNSLKGRLIREALESLNYHADALPESSHSLGPILFELAGQATSRYSRSDLVRAVRKIAPEMLSEVIHTLSSQLEGSTQNVTGIISALARSGVPEAAPGLIRGLQSKDAQVREASAEGLAQLGLQTETAGAALMRALEDPNQGVRSKVVLALGGLLYEPAVPHLIDLLGSPISEQAGEALAKFGRKLVLHSEHLKKSLEQSAGTSEKARLIASDRNIATSAVAELMRSYGDCQDLQARCELIRALGVAGESAGAATELLIKAVDHRNLRVPAAEALSQVNPGELIPLLKHRVPALRALAAEALVGTNLRSSVPALKEAIELEEIDSIRERLCKVLDLIRREPNVSVISINLPSHELCLAGGAAKRSSQAHLNERVPCVGFTPQDKYIWARVPGGASFWDSSTGELFTTLAVVPRQIALTPDHSLAVLEPCDNPGTLQIWEFPGCNRLGELELRGDTDTPLPSCMLRLATKLLESTEPDRLEGHPDWVQAAQAKFFSCTNDCARLVTVEGETLVINDIGEDLSQVPLDGEVERICLSPNGETLLVLYVDDRIQAWNLAEARASRINYEELYGGNFCDFGLTDDGLTAIVELRRFITFWNLETNHLSLKIEPIDTGARPGGSKFPDYLVGPNRQWFAWAGLDGYVRFWNLDNPSPIATLSGHGRVIHGLAVSGDGSRLVTASENRVLVWNTEKVLASGAGEAQRVIALDPVDKRSLVNTGSGAVIWSATGRQECSYEPDGPYHIFDVDEDWRQVVFALKDGRLVLWDTELDRVSVTEVRPMSPYVLERYQLGMLTLEERPTRPSWFAVSGAPNRVFGHYGDSFTLWEGETAASCFTGRMDFFALSADLTLVLLGEHQWDDSREREFQIWDTRKSACECRFSACARAARFSHTGELLLHSSDHLRAHDVGTGDLLWQRQLPHSIYSLVLGRSGGVAGLSDGVLHFFSPTSGEDQEALQTQLQPLLLALSPDGTFIAVADEYELQVWEVAPEQLQSTLRTLDRITRVRVGQEGQVACSDYAGRSYFC